MSRLKTPTPIPRDTAFDATLAFARHPYTFISDRCRRYGADLFRTRFLLGPAICMTGSEAARLFYDTQRLVRRGAMPGRIQKTLLGRGGVQSLDDEAHRHRKAMFMSLTSPQRVAALAGLSAERWLVHARKWASMERVVLYDELQSLLTRAVCDWAGVPLPESEAAQRTRELTALFDAAGSIGPRHWWARLARRHAEKWVMSVVLHIREGTLTASDESAAQIIATHRDLNGKLLSPRIAAVELLNVLRPTVAVAVFIVFVAHALHEYPQCRARLVSGGQEGYAQWFAQEVRRFYPFFPSVIARVRRDFDWNGYHFPRGCRVILDLYGTCHDERAWEAPEEFEPERFDGRERIGEMPYAFIPQGGDSHQATHRCPGEWIAMELMKVATDMLCHRLVYDVPAQDLRIDHSRLPALPRSRMVLQNVRLVD